MSELLVRVQDKTHENFYVNVSLTKRGDVIAVRPDGWAWGRLERSLPFYRIFKIPALSASEAEAYLAPEIDKDPANPSRTLQRRAFRLNIDRTDLPQAVKAYIADSSRAAESFLVSLSLAAIRALKITKPSIQDPAVIG